MALQMQEALDAYAVKGGMRLALRIGIHSGPVVAGVIGRKKFAYDLWGDTVNVASRLESLGQPGAIQVTQLTYERLQPRYRFEGKQTFEIKGRSAFESYCLCGRI